MIASFRARFISRRMHTQWHGLLRTSLSNSSRNYTLQKFQLVCKTYMSCTHRTLLHQPCPWSALPTSTT